MRILFLLARLFPYWAFALGIIFVQLGIFFRRKVNIVQYYCWMIVAFLFAAVLLWVVYRGDLHSDEWVQMLIEVF